MSEKANDSVSRKPDFIAYNVKETKQGKPVFNRVGAAWQHKDGQGYDIQLESIPVNGRVTLRELREERMNTFENERQSQTSEHNHERRPSRGRAR